MAKPAMVEPAVAKPVVKPLASMPGPSGLPGLGVLPKLRADPLHFIIGAAKLHGDIVRLDLGLKQLYLLNHPDLIERVLVSNAQNYRKSQFYERLRPIFGEGLIVAEGAEWRNQRTTAIPAFATNQLKRLTGLCGRQTARLLDGWRLAARGDRPIDISHDMMRLTLGIVMESLFGETLGDHEANDLYSAVTTVLRGAERRIWSVLPWAGMMPTAESRRFKQALAELDRFVLKVIQRARLAHADNLLQHMIQSRHAMTGCPYTDRQLRDQLIFMILAGHETTASALSWMWYLTSLRPEILRKLWLETKAVLGGCAPSYDDLQNLTYTRMVLEETMRLYPPAWTISRTSLGEDELAGYHVPAGTSIMLCPYAIHRDERFWPNPEAFDPTRFESSIAESRPKFSYFPFSGGPRGCIGNRFAMVEAMVVASMVLQRFELHLVPGQHIEVEPMISLRPKNGIMMMLREREGMKRAAA